MEKKNLLTAPPEKVLLMYQAVVEMVKEGKDINCIKVSDITNRAGIGKGTAYEYFASKEAIITQALAYDVTEKIHLLTELARGAGTFEEKIFGIFEFVEEKFSENQTFCTLVRIGTGSYEISETLKQEYQRIQEDIRCSQIDDVIDCIMQQGGEEGILKEENVFLRRMAFSAQVIAFATYLVQKIRGVELPLTQEEAKQFAYKSMVKSLN